MNERLRLQRVVDRLNGRLAGSVKMRCIRWEDSFYKSHTSFQDQIDQAASCDIVISIFWTRLGTELPPEFPEHLPDGRPYPSGTAYELLTALERARKEALPAVYVFRKTDDSRTPTGDVEARRAFNKQLDALEFFWEQWFVDRRGHFRAAFNHFLTTDDFEKQAERLLLEWLRENSLMGSGIRWRIEELGSPFRGLEPFEASHADVFFGRSDETGRGCERLVDAAARGTPFLLVVGPSGTGKSSLARAGLIPRLASPGVVNGIDLWRVARVTPEAKESDPLLALAAALLDADALPELARTPNATPQGVSAQLALGGEAAAGLVRWALQQAGARAQEKEGYDRPVAGRLILLVDQLERLFAPTIAEQARTAFVAVIDALVRSGLVWTIATLRSTEYGLLQVQPTLMKLKEDGAALDLAPPDAVAIAEAIRGPAAAAGLAFERAPDISLDDQLRHDTGTADALPLLQFTLQRLFDGRESRAGVPTLTFATYRALGGLEGAIAAEAERAVSALPEAVQDELPRLLRRLVAMDNRGGAMLTEVALAPGDLVADPGLAALVEALVAARVLALHGGGDNAPLRIRLVHEAVLRCWHRAQSFVESNTRYLEQFADLQAAFERWLKGKEGADYLLRGGALASAEELASGYGTELAPHMRDFVRASRRFADRGRRRAYALAAVLAVLFLGASAAGFYANHQKNVADDNFGVAVNTANAVLKQAVDAFRGDENANIEAIRKLLRSAEDAYDKLSQTDANNPDVLGGRFILYMAWADMFQASKDAKSQEAAARKALDVAAGVVSAYPGQVELQRGLELAHNYIGRALMLQNRPADALEEFLAAFAIAQQFVKTQPNDSLLQSDLGIAYDNMGDALWPRNQLDEALAAYRESLRISKTLANQAPNSEAAMRQLKIAYGKMGEVLWRKQDFVGALEYNGKSLDIAKRLVAANSNNWVRRRDLMVAHGRVGNALFGSRDFAGAVESYRQQLALAERLFSSDPSRADWRGDLRDAYHNLSGALSRQGDDQASQGQTADALLKYREALTAAERTMTLLPTDAAAQHIETLRTKTARLEAEMTRARAK